MRILEMTTAVFLCFHTLVCAEDPVFSGPQAGEKLVPFEARAMLGPTPEEKISVLANAPIAPTLVVFVHQISRPSIAMTRLLMNFASTKKKDGLESQLVFLTNDPVETEAFLRRASHALPKNVSPLISTEGIDGPGSYGLNRNMALTVLVGNRGTVTANFPLVQPSIQVDAPKIGHAIIKALGGDQAPTLKDMGFEDRRMNRPMTPEQSARDATYRRMMSPVIQKSATPVEVDRAAQKVEDMAARTPWFRSKVHHASNLIVGGGRLSNYGTPTAQAYLKKWAKELVPGHSDSTAEPTGLNAAQEGAALPQGLPPIVGTAVVIPASQSGPDDIIRLVVPKVAWRIVGEEVPGKQWRQFEVSVEELVLDIRVDQDNPKEPLASEALDRVLDLQGHTLGIDDVRRRLARPTPVLVSVSGKMPDSYYLRCTQPDTLIVALGIHHAAAPGLLPVPEGNHDGK